MVVDGVPQCIVDNGQQCLPFDIGIALSNALLKFTVNKLIIPKGTQVPIKEPFVVKFKIVQLKQMKIALLEGDCVIAKLNKVLQVIMIDFDHKKIAKEQSLRLSLSLDKHFILSI